MIRVRRVLKYRQSTNYKGDIKAPINLMINSPGGDIYEMFGIIDYIESLDVKVNTICRGRAFSAAAITSRGSSSFRLRATERRE